MSSPIETASQFANTPQGVYERWNIEIAAAKENQKKWWTMGDKVTKRFLDERDGDGASKSRLNLFHSTVTTQRALLYGKQPQVDCDRRFADADDDVARVSSLMMGRLLNTDLERDEDNYTNVLGYALEDWTLQGLGVGRVRYVMQEEDVAEVPAITRPHPETREPVELAPAVPQSTRKSSEDCETDYVFWRDFLWSPCRIWHQARWVAFKCEMTKDEAVKRFGKKTGNALPLQARTMRDGEVPDDLKDTWSRAEVWEIWSKEDKKVYFLCEGYTKILDVKPDPLGLSGFFPCPRPLVSNTTTTKLMPRPDFKLAEDLYNEIDDLSARISLLEEAVKVAGAFDSANEQLADILDPRTGNKMYPVKNWAAFSEKGGVLGAMQFVPLEPIVKAIEVLSAKRVEKISLLYQITGSSDIQRGQAAAKATATEQRLKAGYANTRGQRAQDEFARFASDLQRLRAEVIAKHFDTQTIVDRSNVMRTSDAKDEQGQPNVELIQAAAELIKGEFFQYRIAVRPESISLPDLATMKQDSVEFLGALTGFLAALQPIMAMPSGVQALPYLLEMLKWSLARFEGAKSIESVLDRMVAKAQQAAAAPPPPPQPDPRLQAVQAKAQVDMQKSGMDLQASQAQHQATMQEIVAKAQADRMKAQNTLAVAAARPPLPPMPGGAA